MKNIIGWIIGIIILWFILSGSNSLVGSSQTTDQNSNSSSADHYNSVDDNTGSGQEEDTGEELEFSGYQCTDDCSGHNAGYDWAEEHGVTQEDVDNYSGNSNSFMEGMQSYVDEN